MTAFLSIGLKFFGNEKDECRSNEKMVKQFHHVRGAVRSQVQATVRYRAVREKHAECGGTALKFYCRIKSFSVLSLTNRPSSGATKLKFVYEPALSFFFCLLKFFNSFHLNGCCG